MKNNVVALLPLRGGSRSIPLKNIKPIAGHPLCYWVLKAACDAIGPSNVYVSTESKEITSVVHSLNMGVAVVKRPDELATDTASTESVMLHFAQEVTFNTLITLQATSPMTTSGDITKALDLFSSGGHDSLVTGVPWRRFFWTPEGKPVNYDPLHRPRRQDMEGWIMENGAFYITKHSILDQYKCRLGGNIGIYVMDPEAAAEIDEPEDWALVEQLLMKRKKDGIIGRSKNIKLLVVDVDGTLTDAGMYYSAKGEELKKFNTRDGQGLALLREKGVEVAIITKEDSPIVKARAKKLKIHHCFTGIEDKLSCLKNLCSDLHIAIADTAYVGDDVSDLECMKAVGLSACPSDAVYAIKNSSRYICRNPGGSGAVREVCEILMQ